MKRLFPSVLVGLCLFVLTSQAATIFIPVDQPTIQAGLDSAESGDTVLVSPGAYLETLDFGGKAIVLRSQHGAYQTSLQPRHRDSVTITIESGEPAGTEIDGFTFRGGNRRSVIRLGGGAVVKISNNRFTEASGYQPVIACDGAHVTIERNVFFGNIGPACIGIYSDTVFIRNNTLHGNSRGIFELAGYGDVRNCIISDHDEYGLSGDSIVSDYNVFRNNNPNFANGAGSGMNDLFADPGLTATAYQDFTLRDTSICIDAGDPDSLYFDPDSSRNDIGAYPVLTIPVTLPLAIDPELAAEILTRVADSLPTFTWRYYDSTGSYGGYEIEVGDDNDWTVAEQWVPGPQLVADSSVPYGGPPLADGTVYTARIRLFNGSDWGDWQPLGFATNTPPAPPTPSWPLEGDSVSIDNVLLTVANGSDFDLDSLRYDFVIYRDSLLTDTAAIDTGVVEQSGETSSDMLTGLVVDNMYWWRSRVRDGFEYSAWSDSQSFRAFQGPRVLRVPSEYPSIKAAVTAAASGDTVLVADGVYSGPDNRKIGFGSKQLWLVSENGAAATIIDCLDSLGGTHWGLRTSMGQDDNTVIAGFTIRNASHAFLLEASPTIRNLTFESNDIGVLAYGNFEATLDSCMFVSNDTAVSLESDFSATIRESRLANNLTGVFAIDASVHLVHSTLDSNGRAIYLNGATAQIDTCTLIGNDGGVKSNLGSSDGIAYINGGEFIDNQRSFIGDVILTDVVITGGTTAIETIFPDRAVLNSCTITGVTGRVLFQQYTRLGAPTGSARPSTIPGIQVRGSELYDNPGAIAQIESGVDGDFSILRLDSCLIHHNGGGMTFNGALEMIRTLYASNGGPINYRINDWVTTPHLIDQCTFVDNDSTALAITGETGLADVTRSVLAHNGGIGLSYITTDSTVGVLSCNNVFDNAGGNYNVPLDPTGTDGNISEIVRFCQADTLDYTLYDISGCAPENNSCSTQIGAFPVICYNQSPVLQSPDTIMIFEDSLLVYEILFDDADGPDTIVTVTDLPSWLALSNDTVSGIPTEGIGDSVFTIILDDGFAAETTLVQVLVTPVNDPPVLDSIPDQFAVELDTLRVTFSASDVENDSLVMSVAPLPSGAFVVDSGNGTAVLTWPIDTSQAGLYTVSFIASDTALSDTEIVAIRVQSRRPSVVSITIDGVDTAQHVVDHMPELCWTYVDSAYGMAQTEFEIALGIDSDWEFAEIWNPATFLTSDSCVLFQGAPLVDGETYYLRLRVRNDTLYSPWYEKSFTMNSSPEAPEPIAPENGGRIVALQPTLTVLNGADPDGDSLWYEFGVYADSALDSLVSLEPIIPESPDSSSAVVSVPLSDNTYYWWRARAFDGYEYGPWSDSVNFLVDTAPQPPMPFVLLEQSIDSGATQYDMLPTYRWSRADDPDPDDTVRYRMLLSRDGFMSDTVVYDSIADTLFTVPDSLLFDTEYEWRLEAFDASGLTTALQERLYFHTWTLGDINNSQVVNLSDLTKLVNSLFVTFVSIDPYFIADLDANCMVNLTDIQHLVNYLFLFGPEPLPGCAPPLSTGLPVTGNAGGDLSANE